MYVNILFLRKMWLLVVCVLCVGFDDLSKFRHTHSVQPCIHSTDLSRIAPYEIFELTSVGRGSNGTDPKGEITA
jgi:hypothetical protein